MFWRFGEAAGEGGEAALLYDEVRHQVRSGDGPWVRLPRNPALILSLLLRMQARGREVSVREICAFLQLPKGTRISGHVTELRKKLAECGVAPERVLETVEGMTGYRLASGVHAAPLVEADALRVIEELLADPATAAPKVREQLQKLRAMLLLCSVVAIAFTGWRLSRPGGDEPIARLDEEGALGRTLVPSPTVTAFVRPAGAGSVTREADGYVVTLARGAGAAEAASACFMLDRELGLREGEQLAVKLALVSPSTRSSIAISVERERREDGSARMPFELAAGGDKTLRIRAADLDPGVRSHARRICIGEPADSVAAPPTSTAIKLRTIRVE